MRRRVLVLLVVLAPNAFGQSVEPSAKPPHRQVQTVCSRCVPQAKAVNQAYDGLNFLWDRKLAIQKSIAITQRAMADRTSEIARLEAATPPSGRSLQQQQAIDALKQVNAQQGEGIDKQQRDLAEIDRRIAEQNELIKARMAKLAECEKECATPPADPPIVSTSGPTPSVSSTDTGSVSAITVSCTACLKYVDLILDLQEERADVLSELERLETEADLLFNGTLTQFGNRRVGGREGLIDAIEDGYDELESIEAEIRSAWALLTVCILNCNNAPKPVYSRPSVYGPMIGAGVLGGWLLKGGSETTGSTTPPVSTTPPPVQPSPTQPPAPQPAPQSSCNSINGTYSVGATIRAPRACFILSNTPVFQSPIDMTMTVQLNEACSGTVMTRHPNSWAFAYGVTATASPSGFQIRATTPYMNTQPFGATFNSTIDLLVSGNSVTGTETHMSSSCTDAYNLQGTRQ